MLALALALLIQDAAAAQAAAPKVDTSLPPAPPPAEVIAKNPARQPVSATLPNPPLKCGFEIDQKAKTREYVCRTDAEIQAAKRRGVEFTQGRQPVHRGG